MSYSGSYKQSSSHQPQRKLKLYGRDKKIYNTIRDVDIEYSAKKRSHGELDDWDKFESEIAKHLEGVVDDRKSSSAQMKQKMKKRQSTAPLVISSDDDENVREEAELLEQRLRSLQKRLKKTGRRDPSPSSCSRSPERLVSDGLCIVIFHNCILFS